MRSTKIWVGITPSFEGNINPLWRQAQHTLQSTEQPCTASSEAPALPGAWFPPFQLYCHSSDILLWWKSWVRALSMPAGLSILPCGRGAPLQVATSGNINFSASPSVWHCWFFTSHTQPPGFLCPYDFLLSSVKTCVSTWCNDVCKRF